MVAPPGKPPSSGPVAIEEVREITETIERLGRFLALQINCLSQALVGQKLLRRKGFNAQLKIGVLKNRDDLLTAHAWLWNIRGLVILGDLRGLGQFYCFSFTGNRQQ